MKVKRSGKLITLENRISFLKKNNTKETLRKLHLIKVPWKHAIQTWTHIPTKRSIDISRFYPYDMNLHIQKMKSLPTVSQVSKLYLKGCVINKIKMK